MTRPIRLLMDKTLEGTQKWADQALLETHNRIEELERKINHIDSCAGAELHRGLIFDQLLAENEGLQKRIAALEAKVEALSRPQEVRDWDAFKAPSNLPTYNAFNKYDKWYKENKDFLNKVVSVNVSDPIDLGFIGDVQEVKTMVGDEE